MQRRALEDVYLHWDNFGVQPGRAHMWWNNSSRMFYYGLRPNTTTTPVRGRKIPKTFVIVSWPPSCPLDSNLNVYY